MSRNRQNTAAAHGPVNRQSSVIAPVLSAQSGGCSAASQLDVMFTLPRADGAWLTDDAPRAPVLDMALAAAGAALAAEWV